MLSDYIWVAFVVLMILVVLYYILGLLRQPTITAYPRLPIKQEFYGASSPGTFDQLGARNAQDRYQLVM